MKKQTPYYLGFRFLGLAAVLYITLWVLSDKSVVAGVIDSRSTAALSMLLFFLCAYFLLLFDLFIFPWDYSLFGEKIRHHTPHGRLLYAENYTFGGIGWLYQVFGLVSFKIYDGGLMVSLLGVGDTFIRKDEITDFEHYKLFKSYRRKNPTHAIGGRIYHTCPQIRSPITVSEKTYQELKKEVKPRKEGEFL